MFSRKVIASEVLRDIRNGMSRSELMEKHGISFPGLQGIVSLLVESGAIGRNELYGYFHSQGEEAVVPELDRRHYRASADEHTLIYELNVPEIQGSILDISEEGVRTIGLEAGAEDVMTLVVLGDAFGEILPFEFKAKCRWSTTDEVTGASIAGFQIIEISREDSRQLQRLIESL
jgi:hypothetical protein